MKFLVLIIPCICAFLSFSECQRDPNCPFGYHPFICNPDGKGYSRYGCWGKDDHRTLGSNWDVKCPKKKICKCAINWNADDPDQICRCENPTRPPPFPNTGVIRWNGTDVSDHVRTTIVKGEAHKNSNGNYLMWRTTGWGSTVLDLIIPNGDGTFTKYTYSDYKTKMCTAGEVDSEGSLDSVWERRSAYHLTEQKKKTKGRITQVWSQKEHVDMWGEEMSMTAEYNTLKKVAIPIKYYYNYYDLRGIDENVVNLEYTYEPVDDVTFKPEDYCNNINDL